MINCSCAKCKIDTIDAIMTQAGRLLDLRKFNEIIGDINIGIGKANRILESLSNNKLFDDLNLCSTYF